MILSPWPGRIRNAVLILTTLYLQLTAAGEVSAEETLLNRSQVEAEAKRFNEMYYDDDDEESSLTTHELDHGIDVIENCTDWEKDGKIYCGEMKSCEYITSDNLCFDNPVECNDIYEGLCFITKDTLLKKYDQMGYFDVPDEYVVYGSGEPFSSTEDEEPRPYLKKMKPGVILAKDCTIYSRDEDQHYCGMKSACSHVDGDDNCYVGGRHCFGFRDGKCVAWRQ